MQGFETTEKRIENIREQIRYCKIKAKSKAGGSLTPAEKKALGLKGRVTKKHVAVIEANRRFGLDFKQKDNDIAEAILLGVAYLSGAPICDGKK
jgi:hypothetical protein